MTQPEKILPDELLSRLVFHPFMFDNDRGLIWNNVFQFQKEKGRRESLVWRKYALEISYVHMVGCRLQNSRRKYKGAITALARDITAYQNQNGHEMVLEHVPNEGIWHAEVCCKINPQKKLTGPDRVDLIVHLKNVFSALEPHSCTD